MDDVTYKLGVLKTLVGLMTTMSPTCDFVNDGNISYQFYDGNAIFVGDVCVYLNGVFVFENVKDDILTSLESLIEVYRKIVLENSDTVPKGQLPKAVFWERQPLIQIDEAVELCIKMVSPEIYVKPTWFLAPVKTEITNSGKPDPFLIYDGEPHVIIDMKQMKFFTIRPQSYNGGFVHATWQITDVLEVDVKTVVYRGWL